MGLLSFIYSVLGYNLCATLFIAYLMFDYVLGALATFGARYVITLTPITDLEEDLRIQVYDRRIFAEDDQLGKTLKIPLRELIDNAAVEKWYDIEPTDDKPLKEGEKSAQIKLSIELHGVKATED